MPYAIKNATGELMPLMQPMTASGIMVDGTSSHAESAKLARGVYRIKVVSDAGSGLNILITTAGTAATSSTGLSMTDGDCELFPIDADSIVSVVGGKINIVPYV